MEEFPALHWVATSGHAKLGWMENKLHKKVNSEFRTKKNNQSMTFHQLKKHKIRGEPTKIPSHDFCECRIPPLLILILSKKNIPFGPSWHTKQPHFQPKTLLWLLGKGIGTCESQQQLQAIPRKTCEGPSRPLKIWWAHRKKRALLFHEMVLQ